MAGVPLSVVREVVGHSRASVTLDVYSHVLMDEPPELVAERRASIRLTGQRAWDGILRRMSVELQELVMPGARAWREWLGEHHDESPGVWLVLAKKGTSEPTSLTYEQALEEALCHGWIDGQLGRRDEATYRQRFTPRRRRSAWSQRNAAIAERLLAEGRMHAAGIEEVERAKADGRWQTAYAGSAGIEVPLDLIQALTTEPKAQAMFESLNRQNRYALLYRIATAKRADTRARRIQQFVAMLARGETIYPQRRTSDVWPDDSP